MGHPLRGACIAQAAPPACMSQVCPRRDGSWWWWPRQWQRRRCSQGNDVTAQGCTAPPCEGQAREPQRSWKHGIAQLHTHQSPHPVLPLLLPRSRSRFQAKRGLGLLCAAWSDASFTSTPRGGERERGNYEWWPRALSGAEPEPGLQHASPARSFEACCLKRRARTHTHRARERSEEARRGARPPQQSRTTTNQHNIMGNAHACTSKGALLLVAAANGDTATAQEVGGCGVVWSGLAAALPRFSAPMPVGRSSEGRDRCCLVPAPARARSCSSATPSRPPTATSRTAARRSSRRQVRRARRPAGVACGGGVGQAEAELMLRASQRVHPSPQEGRVQCRRCSCRRAQPLHHCPLPRR